MAKTRNFLEEGEKMMENVIGFRSGAWSVIGEAESRVDKNSGIKIKRLKGKWAFGTIRDVNKTCIMRQTTHSCGCIRKRKIVIKPNKSYRFKELPEQHTLMLHYIELGEFEKANVICSRYFSGNRLMGC